MMISPAEPLKIQINLQPYRCTQLVFSAATLDRKLPEDHEVILKAYVFT